MAELTSINARIRVESITREHHHRHRPLYHIVNYCDSIEFIGEGKNLTALLLHRGESKPRSAVLVKDLISIKPITYVEVLEHAIPSSAP
jgi:hypothetical protein